MELKKGYKKTAVGVIPSDWDLKTLGDVGEVRMCRRVFNSETKSQGSIPFYKIGTFGKEADAYISEDLYDNYRQRFSFPKKGDILISAAGTIGRTIIYDGKPAYFQDSNIVWLDNNGTITFNGFLYHVLQVVNYNTEGGTIQRLYNSILRNTKFICPPTKSEQTAIATALSDVDALITSLEKLIAKKRNIKQGAMQELLKPKKGWFEKKLVDVVDYIHGKAHEQEIVEDGKYVVVNSKFISTEGMVAKYSNANFCPAKTGDVLTVLSDLPNGKALGKCFFVDINGKYAVNQRVCIWRTKGADPRFLFYLLNRHKYFLSLNDGVSQTHILNKHIEACMVSLPIDFIEQREIGEILFDIDNEIAALENRLLKAKMIKQGMMQNLLTGKIRLV